MIKIVFSSIILALLSLSEISAQIPITIGRYDTIVSKVYNEKRVLRISVPTDIGKSKQDKYPVVFVLDGANHIHSLAGMIHRFSHDEGCEVTPEMIVVGVETKNRNKELLPASEVDDFGKHLEDEIIPFIDKNYPTMPYRIFIGHSKGGIRVVHTALFQPDLFNAYIAIDPSLGDYNREWYDRASKKINSFSLLGKKMFVTMAHTMPENMVQDLESIRKDTSGASSHMRAIMEFSNSMAAKDAAGESFDWRYYPDETHASVTQISSYDGLRFVFDYYLNKSWPSVLDGDITNQEALELMVDYYDMISDNMGYEIVPTKQLLNMIIGAIKRREQYEKALLFSEYYLKIYPENKKAKKLIEEFQNK